MPYSYRTIAEDTETGDKRIEVYEHDAGNLQTNRSTTTLIHSSSGSISILEEADDTDQAHAQQRAVTAYQMMIAKGLSEEEE